MEETIIISLLKEDKFKRGIFFLLMPEKSNNIFCRETVDMILFERKFACGQC